MKGILNYIWKNHLLPKENLHTTEGAKLEIISYGHNEEQENIFCNSRVRINDKEWSGNVILHRRSSDWEKEPDTLPCATDNIILHVTTVNNCERLRRHGETIPQLCLILPEGLEKEFSQAEQHSRCLPCCDTLGLIRQLDLNSILSRLAIDRIEEKADNIMRTFTECNNLWDDALFKTIIRSFGFGIQSAVFEDWAKILDMNALGKHRDNLLQVEAIMFGQAGLLDEASIPHYYLSDARKSNYYNEITREYKFLKNKFALSSIDHKEWNCGNATPHVRIARLAALYSTKRIGVSSILACDTASEYYNLIDTIPEGYWHNHTCFGSTETTGNGSMKQRQLDVIIINAIVPTLYIYGKHRNDSAVCNKAEDLLHWLKGEENSIVKKWKEKGIAIECAADSQAIIQLERKYCRMHDCTHCHIAYHYIRERMAKN